MSIIALNISLAVGVLIALSVCYVFVCEKKLNASGIGLSVVSTILLGMSVWTNIKVDLTKLQFEVSQATQKADSATIAAKVASTSVDQMAVKASLAHAGFYKGSLAPNANEVEFKEALKAYQLDKALPVTGAIDDSVFKALKIEPLGQKRPLVLGAEKLKPLLEKQHSK